VERSEAERIVRYDPELAVELLISLSAAVAALTERVERLERRSSRNSHVPPLRRADSLVRVRP